jgi:hypothetical protein
MRWKIKQKVVKHSDWKPWFAWYPVKVTHTRIVWLETIERLHVWAYYYEYRIKLNRKK